MRRAWKWIVGVLVVVVALIVVAGTLIAPSDLPAGRRGVAAAPDVAGVRHQEGQFEGTSGVQLFEESWRPATGEPRATLVIMHGLKDHTGHYAAAAQQLAAHGYAVHAFDLRGHGKSAGRRVWVERFDDYTADLARFLDRVRAAEPGKRLFLFGHSMGGAIATLTTLEKRPALAGLILSGPALQATPDVAGLVGVTKSLGGALPYLPVLDLPNAKFSRDPQVVAGMDHDPLIQNKPGPARTAAELFHAMDRIDAQAAELTVPLLVLHGTADLLTNPEGSKALVAKARSTDKTLKLYDGLYHDLLHEPGSPVLGDLIAWLDARSAGQAATPPVPATSSAAP